MSKIKKNGYNKKIFQTVAFLFDKDDHKEFDAPLELAGENLWVLVGKFTMT